MGQSVITGGTITVDGIAMRITDLTGVGPEVEYLDCNIPDEEWSHTDAKGHIHRWWRRADSPKDRRERELQTPTLIESYRHIECDGSCPNWDCEGYSVREWHCIACALQVEPKFRRGTTTVETSGAYWSMTADVDGPIGNHHIDSTDAAITYPTGPGEVMTMTGRAWEVDRQTTMRSDGPQQTMLALHFVPAIDGRARDA